jgi:hypothetical protein
MKKENNLVTVTIFDRECAAALVSLDYELKSLDISNPEEICFVFNYSEGIIETVDMYIKNKLKVKDTMLCDARNKLESMIRDHNNYNG